MKINNYNIEITTGLGDYGTLGLRSRVDNLEDRVDNLEENQLSGVLYFNTYALMSAADPTGQLNYAYKVIADNNTSLNGDYTSDGATYTQQTNSVNGIIQEGNFDAVSGDTVNDGINDLYKKVKKDYEITYKSIAEVGAANGGVVSSSTLTIPVGVSANGSNLGSNGNPRDIDGSISGTQINEIVVSTIIDFTGNSSEISVKFKPLLVEKWGSGVEVGNGSVISDIWITPNKRLITAILTDIYQKSIDRSSTLNDFYVGLEVQGAVVTQELIATVNQYSNFGASLTHDAYDSLGNIIIDEKIEESAEEVTFDLLFNPSAPYEYATVAKGNPANDSILGTIGGKLSITCVANGDSTGINAGLKDYVIPANQPTRLSALIYLEGVTIEGVNKYFINERDGVRYVDTANYIDLGNGYYEFWVNVDYSVDVEVELLGFQKSSGTNLTVPITVIVKDLGVSFATKSIETIENENTTRITTWAEGEIKKTDDKIVPLEIYVDDYILDLYGNCSEIEGEKGFSCPSGGTVAPSNTSMIFTGKYNKDETINIVAYARISEFLSGTKCFHISKNGGVNQITSYSLVSQGGDLYKIEYSYDTPSNNTEYKLAIQVTSGVPVSDYYCYFDSVYYTQSYTATNDDPSSISTAIDKSITQKFEESAVVNILKVSPIDGESGYDYTGKNAIQLAINSVTDNSINNRYEIQVKEGVYKITNSSEFIGNPGYPAMIAMKDYVDVVGFNKEDTIIWAELPYSDGAIDTATARILHQTVWNFAVEAKMKGVTLVAKDLRYVIHQDDQRSIGTSRYYEDVDLKFIGDKGGLNAWGLGTFSGESNFVRNGKSISAIGNAWACHNNTKFTEPTRWEFENHEFISEQNKWVLYPQSDGSLLKDTLILNGCSFGGNGYIMNYNDVWLKGSLSLVSFNHAEWSIKGSGNAPILFDNDVEGYALKITSNSTGDNSKVSFSTTDDVYSLIIANPRYNEAAADFPNVQRINKFMTNNGSLGLNGSAWGNVDISEDVYIRESVNYSSLGKRLGDCSTTSKTFTINIDAVDYNVVFNQDYTNISNAAIIAEINSVISGVGIASQFIYGREYYLEFTDVLAIAYNQSSVSYIPVGSVLTMEAGRVRLAEDGESIYGIALDNIPVYKSNQGVISGQGRVMKMGYIRTDSTKRFHVNADSQATIGDKYKVVNGQLIKDNINGIITTKDAGVVCVNCY